MIGLGYRLVSRESGVLGAQVVCDIVDRLADAHLRLSEGQGAELAWRDARDKSLRPREALNIYARFLRKMGRLGLPKAPHQGPADFARAAALRFPERRGDIEEISARYIRLRYGRGGSNGDLREFRRRVRRFSVSRRRSGRVTRGVGAGRQSSERSSSGVSDPR